jgi:hypothetical protein
MDTHLISKLKNKNMIKVEELMKININDLPKKFCEQSFGAFGKEVFFVSLISGKNLDTYAMTPQTMKSISEWMINQVKSYENKHGVISMAPEAIQSPIQSNDLSK